MEKRSRNPYLEKLQNKHVKHISPAPTISQSKYNKLSTQMQSLKLNKSEQRMALERGSEDDSQRYEQNDEAFIEFSTVDDPNAFNKSCSNINILQDLDDGYSNREDYRYSKKSRADTDNDILGQLDYLLESSMPSQNDIDIRGFDSMNTIDKFNDIDKFTEELLLDSVDKKVMLEPLKFAREKIHDQMKRGKNVTHSSNMKILTNIEKILDLLKRNECRTRIEKRRILEIFNDIQANGGLPKTVEKETLKKYPDMATFLAAKNEKDYLIF